MSAKTWISSTLCVWLAGAAQAVTCEDIRYLDQSFSVCTVDATQTAISLHLRDNTGSILGHFGALRETRQDAQLLFAMNAGMYHADHSPVGLYIEDGTETAPVITSAGPGNFGLLPNGVLCLSQTAAQVIETRRFVAEGQTCAYATQSGPMLVIDGALHPRFIPDGTSRKIRNGVGTSADGHTAVFAISNQPVNFYDFGRLFRDHLAIPNALFLDGSISRLYAPDLGRSDGVVSRVGRPR